MDKIGRITKGQEKVLRALRAHVALDRASFGGSDPLDLPATPAEVDAFIKERTRVHRECYILPLIDGLLGDCPDAIARCRALIASPNP